MAFRVLSWNINGLRSFKTEMKEFLSKLDADIICFQETKITRDMLEEPLAIVEGYSSYFSFSRKRSGYSGVATFCSKKAAPIYAQEGLSGILGSDSNPGGLSTKCLTGHWTEEELKDLDSEGRAIVTQHSIKVDDSDISTVAVINVYCPRVDPEKPERRVYKLRFYELLRQRAAAIRATGCHVVIVGDINTSHKQIDHCDPDESGEFEQRIDRRYLDQFLLSIHKKSEEEDSYLSNASELDSDHKIRDKRLGHDSHDRGHANDMKEHPLDDSDFMNIDDGGLNQEHLLESETDFQVVDTFRYFHPHKEDAFTCWNTFTNARATNYGTRIDYVFCDEVFLSYLNDSCVLQDVLGSDHCPVAIKVNGELVPSGKLPNICTKFFPEFKGNQQKLSSYFQPASSKNHLKESIEDNVLKRKNISQGTKTSKKSCTDKQIKLNSYFMTKQKNIISVTNSVDNRDVLSQSSGESEGNFLDSSFQEKLELFPPDKSTLSIFTKSSNKETSTKSSGKASGWGFLMKGPKPPPLCPGHNEPAAVRTVKKKGPNMNKQFYACARGAGREGDPNAQCNFFKWVGK